MSLNSMRNADGTVTLTMFHDGVSVESVALSVQHCLDLASYVKSPFDYAAAHGSANATA